MRTRKVLVQPFGYPLRIATSDKAWAMLGLSKLEGYGYTLSYKDRLYIALQETYEEFTVWHEAHHAARFINHHHGIITDHEDHEADVYLQEHIVRLIKGIYQ